MKEIIIEKVIISSSLGSDKAHLESVKANFIKFTNLTLENISAKKSVHDWGVRKGQTIGFKTTLRKEKAWAFLRILKESKLLSPRRIVNGRFIIGIPESYLLNVIEYSPISPKYGLQVLVSFMYTGSNLKNKARNKVKKQKELKEEKINKILDEL